MQSRQYPLRHAMLAISEGIAEFTHQRPQARNALSLELRQDYVDMLGIVEADREVRALIITGSGGSFCAGGDLRSIRGLLDDPDPAVREAAAMRRRLTDIHGWLRRLRDLELPVIAAVDGAAAGAGFSLALAADFVLASERALFSMAFVKIGLVPDMGAMYALPRAVGMGLAKELMYTGRRMDAREAHQRGIVHALHSADTLPGAARRFATRFLDAPREAVALTKLALNGALESSYDAMLAMEGQAQGIAASTAYYRDAIGSFLRGERPRFDWDRAARDA
ncbi:enoyl-CoA hydratase/isomerase family protein [Cupriavidus basilensis]|uniref:enoyl-CoA hydratase/isomerase family protein n=1 Tax=Cupriavidus basilensis TaxID=68895 RepID=UPI0023E8702C|nr:enoyl-CoA hydratase-related protein [Cupriavidus basilensis]MDF3881560.1 enoyl-CoA hydratase-related protein [Cupriavidus basilensis]